MPVIKKSQKAVFIDTNIFLACALGELVDLELVTKILSTPKFRGSGSLAPITFDLLIDGGPNTISNANEIKALNKDNYRIVTRRENYIEIGPVTFGLTLLHSASVIYVYPLGDFREPLASYGLSNSSVSKSFFNDSIDSSLKFNGFFNTGFLLLQIYG